MARCTRAAHCRRTSAAGKHLLVRVKAAPSTLATPAQAVMAFVRAAAGCCRGRADYCRYRAQHHGPTREARLHHQGHVGKHKIMELETLRPELDPDCCHQPRMQGLLPGRFKGGFCTKNGCEASCQVPVAHAPSTMPRPRCRPPVCGPAGAIEGVWLLLNPAGRSRAQGHTASCRQLSHALLRTLTGEPLPTAAAVMQAQQQGDAQ